MRFRFPTLILASAVAAAVALAPNTAKAEQTRINVPFTFSVAGKICPAGDYLVKRVEFGNFVRLESSDFAHSFNFVSGPANPDKNGSRVVLKFDELGETHVLQSIQYGSLVTSRLDKKKSSEDVPTREIRGQ